jgi:hypothetical protein
MADNKSWKPSDPSVRPASNPVTSQMADDGLTVLAFPDGQVARVPSSIIRDGLGRSFDLDELYERTGNAETNQLLRAILRELVALRQMHEMQSEMDAAELSDEALAPV